MVRQLLTQPQAREAGGVRGQWHGRRLLRRHGRGLLTQRGRPLLLARRRLRLLLLLALLARLDTSGPS
jgi:hypothetical protein